MSQSHSKDGILATGRSSRGWKPRSPSIPASEMDEHVLKVLSRAPTPLSAYDIVGALLDTRKTVAATPIYRALGRLIDRGQIERIELLSAYRVRTSEKCIHAICESCGSVLSIPASKAVDVVDAAIRNAGFFAQRLSLEASGRCADCERSPRADADRDCG